MRIIQIVPGTGNFYCGTCLRDHALARGLRSIGHDATMAPLYLPLVLEGDDEAQPILFGGINLYLEHRSKLIRALPHWMVRWLDQPWLLRWAASRSSMTRASVLGEVTVSMLRGEEGRQTRSLNRLANWLATTHGTDVVCLATALLVGMARRIKQSTGAPVVCTLQGEDAFLDSLPQPHRDEAWATMSQRAADVDAFVAVSGYYADVMKRRLDLPTDRVHVVHNGIDLEGFEPATQPPPQPVLGYLARMCRDKGLQTLVETFVLLRQRGQVENLKLRIAGARTRADEPFVDSLRKRLASAGLLDDVAFLPNIDRRSKLEFLRSISVLSVPATYGEAFGLYILEALGCGVPVVQPRHGAFAELLEITGGGILCKPDDPPALAEAIESVFHDLEAARAEAARARGVVFDRFNANRMADEVARVCEQVVARKQSASGSGDS